MSSGAVVPPSKTAYLFDTVQAHTYSLGGVLTAVFPSEMYDRSIHSVQQGVLSEIARSGSRGLVIDLGPVELVDQFIAHAVLDLARMARMIGVRTVVTGIKPETAAVLAALGVDTGTTPFAVTVGEALEILAMQQR